MSRLKHLTLRNLRGFKKLDLQVSRKRTLIIGPNGTCKSTLLRAIALAACSEGEAHALLALRRGSYVTSGISKAQIRAEFTSGVTELSLYEDGDLDNPASQMPHFSRATVQGARQQRLIPVASPEFSAPQPPCLAILPLWKILN